MVTVTGSSSDDLTVLLQQLDADRAWLLQQIDGGRWPDLRLDLAALERELGQMISRVGELEEESGGRRAQKGISSVSGTRGAAFQLAASGSAFAGGAAAAVGAAAG